MSTNKNAEVVSQFESVTKYSHVQADLVIEQSYRELLKLRAEALHLSPEADIAAELQGIKQTLRANCYVLEDLHWDLTRKEYQYSQEDYYLRVRDSLAHILLGCVLQQTLSGKLDVDITHKSNDLLRALVDVATCPDTQSLAAFAVVLDYFPEQKFEEILGVVAAISGLHDFRTIATDKLGGFIEDWPLYNMRVAIADTDYAPSTLIAIQLYQDQEPALVAGALEERLAKLHEDLTSYYYLTLAFKARAWDTGGKRLRESLLASLPSPAFDLRDTRFNQHDSGVSHDTHNLH